MATSEALKRAQRKYDETHRDNYKNYFIKCNKQTENDIIEFLEKQGNKQGTIKELIRKEIAGGN